MRKSLKKGAVTRQSFKEIEPSVVLNKVVLKYCSILESDLCLSLTRVIPAISYGVFRSKIHTYCLISGRSRGLVTKFKVSRIVFREFSSEGFFVGVRKSGW